MDGTAADEEDAPSPAGTEELSAAWGDSVPGCGPRSSGRRWGRGEMSSGDCMDTKNPFSSIRCGPCLAIVGRANLIVGAAWWGSSVSGSGAIQPASRPPGRRSVRKATDAFIVEDNGNSKCWWGPAARSADRYRGQPAVEGASQGVPCERHAADGPIRCRQLMITAAPGRPPEPINQAPLTVPSRPRGKRLAAIESEQNLPQAHLPSSTPGR